MYFENATKNLAHLFLFNQLCSNVKLQVEDEANFRGLPRISELYFVLCRRRFATFITHDLLQFLELSSSASKQSAKAQSAHLILDRRFQIQHLSKHIATKNFETFHSSFHTSAILLKSENADCARSKYQRSGTSKISKQVLQLQV